MRYRIPHLAATAVAGALLVGAPTTVAAQAATQARAGEADPSPEVAEGAEAANVAEGADGTPLGTSEGDPQPDAWDLQSRLERLTRERAEEEAAVPESSLVPAPTPSTAPTLGDAQRRRDAIEAHRPRPSDATGGAEGAWVPSNVAALFYARAGWLWETLSLHERARDAYADAIASGRDDPDTWRGLGRMRLRTGDFDGAEAAFLAAFELGLNEPVSPRDAALAGELAELYLTSGRPADAVTALEGALAHAEATPRLRGLLARARHEATPYTVAAPVQPVALLAASPLDVFRARVEAALRSAAGALPRPARDALASIDAWSTDARGRLALYGAFAVALVVLVVVHRTQTRGDVAVTVGYPTELVGSFSVRVSVTPGRYKRAPRGVRTAAAQQPTRASTRTEHYGVSRETHFRGLPARLYYVTVEGVLHDPETGETIADPFEEEAVRVEAKRTVQLDFDVAPRASVVDVRVTWNKKFARDVAVAVRGLPHTLRYARDGTTKLPVAKGRHTILVGAGDRVAEREVDLDSFRPIAIEVDLGDSDDLVFKGCPPAVEPYLNGDVSTAARALERDGHGGLANVLLGILYRDLGQFERAAEHFERGGKLIEAAALYAGLERFADAARLYQQGGDFARAGKMLRETGDLVRAGDCFEKARKFEEAIACFEEAHDIPRLIDAVEQAGDSFAAAGLAVAHSDQARVIRLLQHISSDHAKHREACEMLVDAYLAVGHRDLAARKLQELVEAAGPEGAPEAEWRLAEVLEEDGDYDGALSVLAALREREPTYPNIATVIEGLRKKLTERQLADASGGPSASTAQTAFLAESRYEILGEIGRGGMGVVLKARDTRLDRIVALKRLPEVLRDHPKAIELFLREAQSAARLNHPNIVTVYDSDQEDGQFFITMELLEGAPISRILKQRGKISPRNAAQLGVQIAAGLEYAHGKGIVHRDVKSANLFFTRDKVVKIMDFGLAKMMEEVRRGTTVVGGTPYYMSPEQAAGEPVDARTDIYALGVTLYEFVTGAVPFTEGDVTYQHRHAPVPDPRLAVPGLPDAYADLVLAMMQKRAEDRISSAAEVGRRLQQLIG